MENGNKSKSTVAHKKEDLTFNSEHTEHVPSAESDRAALGYHDKQLKTRNERSKEVSP